jgi:hypothetical protein
MARIISDATAIDKVLVVGARGVGAKTRPSVRRAEVTLPRDVEQVDGQMRWFALQPADIDYCRLASQRRDS